MKNLPNWYFRLAVLYLLTGIGFGIYMASSEDLSLAPLHAHLNLLGWVSLALFGLFFRNWPAAAESVLAKVQLWVYVPAHFVQMVCLFLFLRGNSAVNPLLGLSSVLVGLAIVCFAINVWRHTGAAAAPGASA